MCNLSILKKITAYSLFLIIVITLHFKLEIRNQDFVYALYPVSFCLFVFDKVI